MVGEALVVLPVVIFMVAVSAWAWQLYEAKIDAMNAVRGPVFSEAAFGCGNPGSVSFEAENGPGQALLEAAGSDLPLAGADGVDLAAVGRKLPRAPGADVIDRVIDSRGARLVRPFVSNGFVGADVARLGAHTSMMCNEAVRDGDAKAMKALSASSFDPRSP